MPSYCKILLRFAHLACKVWILWHQAYRLTSKSGLVASVICWLLMKVKQMLDAWKANITPQSMQVPSLMLMHLLHKVEEDWACLDLRRCICNLRKNLAQEVSVTVDPLVLATAENSIWIKMRLWLHSIHLHQFSVKIILHQPTANNLNQSSTNLRYRCPVYQT